MLTNKKRTFSSGQAAIEFAIGVFLFAFIFSFILEFAPVLLENLKLQSEARTNAGISALRTADFSSGASEIASFPSYAPSENTIPGFAIKPFHFTFSLAGEPLVSEEGTVKEEIFLPTLGGFPVPNFSVVPGGAQ